MVRAWKSIGAALLAFVLTTLFVLPGVNALTPAVSTDSTQQSFIAAASNESDDALRFMVRASGVDPEGDDEVRVYFSVHVGTPGREAPADTRIVRAGDDKPLLADGTEADSGAGAGITVVLAGAMAKSIKTCDDPNVNQQTAAFDELSDAEARAVVEALSPVDSSDSPQGGEVNSAAPWNQADQLSYVTLRPQKLFSASSISFRGDAGVSFGPSFNYWSCTFSASAFVRETGPRIEVTFPRLVSTVGHHSDKAASIEAIRTLTVADNANITPVSLVGEATRDSSGLVQAEREERVLRLSEPTASINEITLSFQSEEGSRERDRSILVAGIAIAFVAALFIDVLKQFVPAILWWRSRSRVNHDEP